MSLLVGEGFGVGGSIAAMVLSGFWPEPAAIIDTVPPVLPGAGPVSLLVTEGFGAGGSMAAMVLSGFWSESAAVVDTVPPVLALFGANPMTMTRGERYVESGYTAVDDVDGNISHQVVITGTVNQYVVGQYTLTYTVSDAAGNITRRSRVIQVVEPVIAPVPTTPLEIKQQQLKEIQSTISKIQTHGQSYVVMDGGAQRHLTRANLKTLMERERQLELEISRMQRSGGVVIYGLPK